MIKYFKMIRSEMLGEFGTVHSEEEGLLVSNNFRTHGNEVHSEYSDPPVDRSDLLPAVSASYRNILKQLGEDPTREGLLDTPMRAAKAMMFFTRGYQDTVSSVVKNAVFNEPTDEMVVVKDIEMFSLCEHHLDEAQQESDINQIKLLLILQHLIIKVQERMTREVAAAVWEAVAPAGVGVVIEACHMCMVS
ncbi:GTP cyclohydrolase 1 [Eurytemora carolleeae]|uniref:GTP cyclohydrolase 1 n=1 Tax=Eurytemora carolleeae TaxID=1294199 RepID=UPI000C77B56D|nr:GTP cyclohydrolase 1 [Eurytemora carolleeae]|eukprot:XP_023332898.1 GTP cyclohydrolase 1-like [Eurytemora affinis]